MPCENPFCFAGLFALIQVDLVKSSVPSRIVKKNIDIAFFCQSHSGPAPISTNSPGSQSVNPTRKIIHNGRAGWCNNKVIVSPSLPD
ncbi:unnamed protein product [Orchesella dallaii]|uniref:Uncharacterized protein n=1 Tax=Orchesella dallaii TaxID=48710 RepID=A0ABP1R394_9HEXA